MKKRSIKGKRRGFSLLEMTIAMAVGTVVLGAAVQLYSQGLNATWVASQRAEMQQDFRAATNMLTRDLSMAGGGLGNNVQIALPYASGAPVFGCDQSKCYINNAAQPYPKQGSVPYLYGLIPGYQIGPSMNGLPTDTVTSIFTDNNFYLSCYQAKVTSSTVVLFQLPSPLPATCTLPSGMTTPQALNDSVVGLTIGDVLLFTWGTGTPIVAEVTALPTVTAPQSGFSSAYNVTFASSDALKMNQTGANSLASQAVGTLGQATRILITSYYIDNSITPPRFMRQVSGHTPMPVAEGIVYFQLTYDLFDWAQNKVQTNLGDAGASLTPPMTPNQVMKINIVHMAMDSTTKSGLFGLGRGYQSLDLETSVAARDLSYQNGYPLGP